MKPDRTHHHNDPHTHLVADVEARQRNTVWPDPVRNSRFVDVLLWRTSPDASKVQRVGIAVFGITFLSIGAFTFPVGA